MAHTTTKMTSRKIDIIRQPIPTLLATFGVLVTLLTIRSVRSPHPAEVATDFLSPLGVWLNGVLGSGGGVAFTICATIVSSIIITRIISRYSISVIRSFVPLVLYIIGVGMVVFSPQNPSLHLCWLLLLRSAELMIAGFKRYEMFDSVMCSAVYVATAALLVPDLVWILPLLIIEWFIFRRSPREMVAAVVAMCGPVAICTFAWWTADHNVWCFAEGWAAALTKPTLVEFGSLISECGGLVPTIALGLYTFLSLLSIATVVTHNQGMRLRARKIHVCFTLLWLIGLAMLLFGVPLAVALPTMAIGAIPIIHTFFVKQSGLFSALYYVALVVVAIATLFA